MDNLLLAFDTCLDKTYVVLRTENDIISSETIQSNEKSYHSAYLISTIKEILKASNKTPKAKELKVFYAEVGDF